MTDVMVEAACVKYLDLMVEATGNEDETVAPEFMRAAIAAALAVQPVPTDAEIEKAIDDLTSAAYRVRQTEESTEFGDSIYSTAEQHRSVNRERDARANLLRLIAAQREAAVREALRPVHQAMSELWDRLQTYPRTIGYGQGFGDGLDWAHEIFDAMLAKEATDDQ